VDGYLARGAGFAIVAFRGTEPDQSSDVFDDAKFAMVEWEGSPHRVHMGFRDALRRVWPTLHSHLAGLPGTDALWFTGHSLGGALATLAAVLCPRTTGVCTLGSPRVGDKEFAVAFSARFGERSRRYVADTDIVSQVPPPTPLQQYRHVNHLRQINQAGTIGSVRTSMTTFFTTLVSDVRYLHQMLVLLQTGTMTAAPKFLLDHMPVGYTVDLWNDYDACGN
jgi:triacylglycerol lipase